jgi:hypothetical protein
MGGSLSMPAYLTLAVPDTIGNSTLVTSNDVFPTFNLTASGEHHHVRDAVTSHRPSIVQVLHLLTRSASSLSTAICRITGEPVDPRRGVGGATGSVRTLLPPR